MFFSLQAKRDQRIEHICIYFICIYKIIIIIYNTRLVAYLGGHAPPPAESPKTFLTRFKLIYFAQKCPQNAGSAVSETQISKWDFKPIYFAQKCPQNAGNAVSETQISNFRGACPRTPLQLCRHYGLPLTKILATPLNTTHNTSV